MQLQVHCRVNAEITMPGLTSCMHRSPFLPADRFVHLAEERRLINEGELSTWSIDKLGGYETVVFPTGPYNTTKGFPDNFPLPPANSDLTVEDPPGSGQ